MLDFNTRDSDKADYMEDESGLERGTQSESSYSGETEEQQNSVIKCEKCPKIFRLRARYERHKKHHQYERYSEIDKVDTEKDLGQSVIPTPIQIENESILPNREDPVKKPRKGLIKCSQCPDLFRFPEKYEIHLKLHNGIRPFTCDQCQKSYKKLYHLNRHKKTHSVEQTVFRCSSEGCDKTFSRKESLRSHLNLKHSGQPEKREMCDECGKSFVNISYLKTHKLSHLGSDHYPFECKECSKKFLYKKTVDEHVLRVHTDIRNFVCQICGAKKATKNSLRAHVNTHTRERLYTCKDCPKVFASSANLAIHTNCVHKKIKKHKCQYCGYAFSRMRTCKLHERTHTGEKPHACGVCGKTFAQSTARNTHQKTHIK